MTTVLLVGARSAAVESALRMGLRVYLLTETRPRRAVRDALAGVWVVPFATPFDALWAGVQQRFDGLCRERRGQRAVVALTESSVTLAAKLRSKLRLVGTDVPTAQHCREKCAMKRQAREAGIPCADLSRVSERTTAAALVRRLGLPLVLKPAAASGSRGTFIAKTCLEVREHMGPGQVAESFVHGVEMSVEALVSSGKICFFNPSEYLLPLWANVVPATLPEAVEQQVRHLTQRVVEGFGIERGMLHLELFLTPDGPVFGEVAMRPPGGHLMELIEKSYGFDIWEALLRVELGQTPQLPASAQRFSGVWFLHPGEGKVTAVTGVEAARRVLGVDEVECRLRAGERVERRESSGQSCGHIMASGDSREKVVAALKLACRSIVVETKRVPRRGAVRRHRAA